MLDTTVIYTEFFSELQQERQDHDRFPPPGKDNGFGIRGLMLSMKFPANVSENVIYPYLVWIAVDNKAIPKDARNNHHLPLFFTAKVGLPVPMYSTTPVNRNKGGTAGQDNKFSG